MISITDLTDHICLADASVQELLGRLDRSPKLFQIILDKDGRMLGTVTDGDIRRAMLRGVGLDAAAAECMQSAPRVGHVGDIHGNWQRLAATSSRNAFLPVVDECGKMVEILVSQPHDSGVAQALVMAGGFGKRFGEHTKDTPKPLLPVAGKPLLEHVLCKLEDSGVERIHIAVHYLSEQVRAFVDERPNRAEVSLIEEQSPLGTAGALGRLEGELSSPVLVVNADVLTRLDINALDEFQWRHGLDGTVGVARHEVTVPFGVVRFDENGLFETIEEKPSINYFVAAGVYYLSPKFAALLPRDKPMDMPELLNIGHEIGLKIGLFPIHEYWTDIGWPEALAAADEAHGAGNAS